MMRRGTWSAARKTVAQSTPLQIVKDKFGGRQKLVEQLSSLVDKQHGDDDAATKSRLMGLSNAKLLRLYKVEQAVRERYGDRAKLVSAIVDARKKAGMTVDDGVKTKLAGFTKARLLDLAKMKLGDKPAKQTPAERLAKKRGRKQLERAKSKLK